MQNIVFNNVQTFTQSYGSILNISFEQASSTITLVNHEYRLVVLEYSPKQDSLKVKQKTNPLQQFLGSKIQFVEFLVEKNLVLCITEQGKVLAIDSDSNVDVKAQNEDGIVSASMPPTQQYIYIVTKNSTLIQLDSDFDLINEIPLDQNQSALPQQVRFSWRPDGNFFSINFQVQSGRKCVTRDKMMNIFCSPSKSDSDPKGLVQSVAEKGRKNLGLSVAWQPSGSIIAGTDEVDNKQRVIFWEKNGLLHLSFQLPLVVSKVINLFWSPDSSVLYVEAQSSGSRVLYLYYRSNYKWHLKNQINLNQQEKILVFKTNHNKVLLAQVNKLKLIDWSIELSKNEWLNANQQNINSCALVYCIDGNKIKISDYAKSLIPPPYSLKSVDLQNVIIGHSIKKNQILLITSSQYKLYSYTENKIIKSWLNTQKQLFFGIELKSDQSQPLQFVSNFHFYRQKDGKILREEPCPDYKITERKYRLNVSNNINEPEEVEVTLAKNASTLTVNNQTLTEDCLSYLCYHEFLIYIVSTNGMYDRLFVLNFKFDRWFWDDTKEVKLQEKISQLQEKQALNVRNVERGAKIMACTKGRIVFQMLRGNLEAINPKVIMINQVKKKMQQKEYGLAFQIIRTHRLDYNLIFDINQKAFIENADQILKKIKRVDYLNLLISQISELTSKQIVYCLSQDEIDQVNHYYQANLKGKKVHKLCQIISKQLRLLNQSKYILSILTSDLRRGLLHQVLFEIKLLKQSDQETVVPPHVVKTKNDTISEKQKTEKKLTSQEVLEYVCWLVDANFIYQAALLTYDLELAAMAARCTQKDPKEYIPYIESLKQIKDKVQFKKKICLDLKKYDLAIKQLSIGSEAQQQEAIDIVDQHKLFKCGLQTFGSNMQKLKQVKQIIVKDLLASGEINQAYQLSKSFNDYQSCLKIAVSGLDTKKIKQCLQNINISTEQKKQRAKQITNKVKDQIKNKSDLARLYIYIGDFQQAVSLYLKNSDYKKFYQYISKVSQQFIDAQVIPSLKLQSSLQKNLLLKDKNLFQQKQARLLKVHKMKKSQGGQAHIFRNKENEDMYSEVSMASKASSYTISTTTGMRKKKDKKRGILTRNVKQGSILEEEYLLAFLQDLKLRAQENIKTSKSLVQHLIYMNLINESQEMKEATLEYIEVMNSPKSKSFAKLKFEQTHPEAAELYFQFQKNIFTFDSFNYLLK